MTSRKKMENRHNLAILKKIEKIYFNEKNEKSFKSFNLDQISLISGKHNLWPIYQVTDLLGL